MRQFCRTLNGSPIVLPISPEDSTLVFLPSAHIAQRIVLEIVPMRMGTPVWFSESLNKLPNELRAIRPTIFLAPAACLGENVRHHTERAEEA